MKKSNLEVSLLDGMAIQGRSQEFNLEWTLLNSNLNRHNTKKKKKCQKSIYIVNINKNIKQKTHYDLLQLISTYFYIFKPLYDNYIINVTTNVFLYIYNQAVIHPLITHLTTPSSLCNFHS